MISFLLNSESPFILQLFEIRTQVKLSYLRPLFLLKTEEKILILRKIVYFIYGLWNS